MKTTKNRRLDPGVSNPYAGSAGLGATDEEMLAARNDPEHMAMLREAFSFLDDEAFAEYLASTGAEMARPTDGDEGAEEDDE